MAATPWLIGTDDPAARTLLTSLFGESTIGNLEFVRRDGRPRQLQFVQRNEANLGVLWSDSAFDAASEVVVAIGNSNTPPTSGTFALSYNGDATGLGSLAYNISASALQTALNANPAVTTAGGVTVAKGTTDGDYIVTFNTAGARFIFGTTFSALVPPSAGSAQRIQTGDGSTKEVQSISFKQGYLAYNTFSSSSSGTIGVTVDQTGSATQPSIQTVSISSNVRSGTWTAQISQAQVCKIACSSNSATCAKYIFTFPEPTTGINSKWVDLFDAAGPVRIWFNFNATGVAPPTPTGGRIVAVASATDSAVAWRAALITALTADSGFDIVAGGSSVSAGQLLTIAGKTLVSLGASDDSNITSVTVSDVAANFGQLDQQSVILADPLGDVGVWINLSSATAAPAALDDCTRLIQVTSIAATSSGASRASSTTQVATAIAAALDADAEFVSTSSVNIVTSTSASVGDRNDPTQNTPLLGVSVSTRGYTVAGSFPIDATAGDLDLVFGDYYRAAKSGDFDWTLTATSNGTNATMTVSGANLSYAPVFNGTLVLNTWPMALAFQATTADEIDSTLEVQVTQPGESPIKVLNIPVKVRRDVITGAGLAGISPSNDGANVFFLGSVTGYIGGAATDLDAVVTTNLAVPRMVTFVHATEGQRWYVLRAGTDAESSPAIIRPNDYAASTNEKVWQSTL